MMYFQKTNFMGLIKKYKTYILLSVAIVMCHQSMIAQTFTKTDATFTHQNTELFNSVSGGFNSPAFYQFDLDGDGLDEIIVYDRLGKVFSVYAYDLTKEQYIYQLNPPVEFPKLHNWVFLADYNGDGIVDIFSCPNEGAFGFGVWKGRQGMGRIVFDRVDLQQGFFNVLYFPGSNGPLNLYCSNIDIPFLIDIDGDGDLDIFTFQPDGVYLEYYRNESVEKGFGTDTLLYVRQDLCYGKFMEHGFSNEIIMSSNPESCAQSFDGDPISTRHAGSTVLLKDINKDGKIDILLGDVAFNNITYLTNTATNNKSYITSYESHFPQNNQINLGPFPAGFQLYVGPERTESLVFASNAGSIVDESQGVWLYHYDGNESNNYYSLETKNFLSVGSIDLGMGFHPSFYDVDGDGKPDMIAGNRFNFVDGSYDAGLVMYKNTSTPGNISFKIADEDYLGLKQLGISNYGYKPVFYDIDHDGFIDLFIGTESGYIMHYESTTKPPQSLNFQLSADKYFGMRVPSRAAPALADVDGDGLVDFLVGDKNGNIAFFKNTGSSTVPEFHPVFNELPNVYPYGKISVKEIGETEGSAAPSFLHFQDETYLVAGSKTGHTRIYRGLSDANAQLVEVNDFAAAIYDGEQNHPLFYDVDGDGLLELINGNIRGGVAFYRTDISTDGHINTHHHKVENEIKIFPSITHPGSTVQILSSQQLSFIEILDLQSKKLAEWKPNKAEFTLTLPVNILPGMYLIRSRTVHGAVNVTSIQVF